MVHLANALICSDHRFLKAGIYEVNFFGAPNQISFILVRDRFADHPLDGTHQLLIPDFFQVFLKASEPHVGQVLSPFKIRYGDSTGIQEYVGND